MSGWNSIPELGALLGEEVRLRGWVDGRRSSGRIGFIQLRESGATVQLVISRKEVDEASWEALQHATQESTVAVTGTASADPRSPGGVEIHVSSLALVHGADGYPITPKEHGTAFLMDHRHLWLRSSRQRAVLRIRSEVCQAIHNFHRERGYYLVDSPILTPAACEGTSTLFETPYFDHGNAYLSQSGQLYLEPAAAALGKVYCFGPTFRAEKSKTRRHLMEFWMVEPEAAFLDFEDFVVYLAERVLEHCADPLRVLERDTSRLEAIRKPFPRLRYAEAIDLLRNQGSEIEFGDDFGAPEETSIAEAFERPVMVTHYPTSLKAFYMEPDPDDPTLALALDVIAPEGYGEIIGGSQRIHDHDLLLSRLKEHDLPIEAFQWYLDIRRYGTFEHSGFGMGVERFVAWMAGVPHLRETIPYPRTMDRIYP
ncbi:MAG: asparagine--tRNA ligase [Acidobacteria bacterium]|nr:asparagine--tRNA ligase [Acidobacteriota bacterium]